ncbi:MAG TPA: hypothetical protein VKP00_06560 [Gemmatimonadaceae bacterium]|nr:hypothetical protein [Gemmatimonadaceae bacterium]
MRVRCVVAASLLVSAALAQAQRVEPVAVTALRATDSLARSPFGSSASEPHVSPEMLRYAPIASAITPGAGQFMLGHDRFLVYAAVEVLGWWKYLKDTHEQSRQEAVFKDLARAAARSRFSTSLPDGGWSYYEQMRDWKESGVYSQTTAGAVVPETDTLTFNGTRWRLAQATHSNDPAAAVADYERLAIKPEFRWSWRNAEFQWDIFKRTTETRNDAYHAGVTDLAVIAANHALSMVDAFVAFRLQVQPAANGRTNVGASLRW